MSNEELVIKIKSGTDTSHYFDVLWHQMKGLIYLTAKRYSCYAELDDLLQESFLALYGAVYHFDENADIKFSSYAIVCIKRHLYRYINQNHMTENNTVSLNTPIGSSDAELCLCDTIAGEEDTELQAVNTLYCDKMKETLWSAVDVLPDMQSDILRMLYKEKYTMKDAGSKVGITKDDVAAIKVKALYRLRHCRHTKSFKEYLEYFELQGNAMHGTGVLHFHTTWTSATEREAIKSLSNL